MRLRDIHRLLETHLDAIAVNFEGVGNNQVNFANRTSARKALNAISTIPSLSRNVQWVLEQDLFTNDSSLSAGNNKVVATVTKIQTDGRALLNFLTELLPPKPDGYFTVRLPAANATPSSVAERFELLTHAFEQPVLRVYGVPINVSLVEPGSIVAELSVLLPAAAALSTAAKVSAAPITVGLILKFIGKLLDLGIQKAKLQQELAIAKQKQFEVQQSEAKAKQEEAKAAQEIAKARQEEAKARQAELAVRGAELKLQGHDHEIDATVHGLVVSSPDPNDAFPIVRNSVDSICKLYSEDATFHLQLDAPKDVETEFPTEALGLEPTEMFASSKPVAQLRS